MTLIASLLFAIALFVAVGVIMLTVSNAMPRIKEVIEMEFAPVVKTERRIIFGEVRGRMAPASGHIIVFPRKNVADVDYRIAA